MSLDIHSLQVVYVQVVACRFHEPAGLEGLVPATSGCNFNNNFWVCFQPQPGALHKLTQNNDLHFLAGSICWMAGTKEPQEDTCYPLWADQADHMGRVQ